MKTQKEITQEARRVRERVKGFSGYWIGEAAAAIQALEWAVGKRGEAPSEDIGKTGGEHEKIAAGLLKAVEKAPAKPAAAPLRPSAPPRKGAKAETPEKGAKTSSPGKGAKIAKTAAAAKFPPKPTRRKP